MNQTTTALLIALTPTVTCLIGIILARQDVRDLRTELRAEISSLRVEIRSEAASLRAEMVALRNQVHADLLLIHERVAVVESKQNN